MCNTYIQTQIDELRALSGTKEQIEKNIKEREKVIKDYMQTNGLYELNGKNGERITYSTVVSNRFDTTRFKQQFKELYNAYLKTTSCLKFKITF